MKNIFIIESLGGYIRSTLLKDFSNRVYVFLGELFVPLLLQKSFKGEYIHIKKKSEYSKVIKHIGSSLDFENYNIFITDQNFNKLSYQFYVKLKKQMYGQVGEIVSLTSIKQYQQIGPIEKIHKRFIKYLLSISRERYRKKSNGEVVPYWPFRFDREIVFENKDFKKAPSLFNATDLFMLLPLYSLPPTGMQKSKYQASVKMYMKALEGIIDFANSCDYSISLKPHPRENNLQEYAGFFSKYNEVKIIDNQIPAEFFNMRRSFVINMDSSSQIFGMRNFSLGLYTGIKRELMYEVIADQVTPEDIIAELDLNYKSV